MNTSIRLGLVLCALGVFAGCTTEEPTADRETSSPDEEAMSAGHACRTFGNPRLTKGCDAGETCVPTACTNSIPPSCIGTCEAAPEADSKRCDVTGSPPVTTGCDEDQECAVEACTNSIPPHCFGHCE